MSDLLTLDWDDQHLIGVDAHVASRHVNLRKWFRFDWTNADRPSEDPQAAGKRLREELDRAGIRTTSVVVSLPREASVVRLLELPECTDNEMPELVRFQAVTRSSIPLDRLLLDFLPLPRVAGVEGRRVLMVTLGKPTAERIQSVLAAAGLEAQSIRLGAVGAAEVISRQPTTVVDPAAATLTVACTGMRVEITATWQNHILLMHAASLSSHESPDAMVTQILAEAARATVAYHQAAPGMRIGAGWVVTGANQFSTLPAALTKRFGFEFRPLDKLLETPGLQSEIDANAFPSEGAIGPVGLLLAEAGRLVESIDFLHPRRTIVKPDRRRLYQIIAGVAVALILVGVFVGIQLRVANLNGRIAREDSDLSSRQKMLEAAAPVVETAKSVGDWTRRDLDWLDQLHHIAEAMGGPDKLYLTKFEVNTASRNALAVFAATGHAKSRDDAEEMEDRLAQAGYQVAPQEIVDDPSDRQYPLRIPLKFELVELPPTPPTSKTAQAPASVTKPAAAPAAAKQ